MFDPQETPWLHEHALLTEQDCQHWTQRVLAMRPSWTPRHRDAPFFTLGMAAYLDAIEPEVLLKNRTAYATNALRDFSNRMIDREFSALLEMCRHDMANWSGVPALFDPVHTALPGFHIHLPHEAFAHSVASIHSDLQFQQVFPRDRPRPNEVITFTLPVSLPVGAGLNVWTGDEVCFHPYKTGHIYLHSGLHRHQAVLHPQAGDTPRICLQGHGLMKQGQLILYW